MTAGSSLGGCRRPSILPLASTRSPVGNRVVQSFEAVPEVERVRGGGDATVKTLLKFRISYKTRFGENVSSSRHRFTREALPCFNI